MKNKCEKRVPSKYTLNQNYRTQRVKVHFNKKDPIHFSKTKSIEKKKLLNYQREVGKKNTHNNFF